MKHKACATLFRVVSHMDMEAVLHAELDMWNQRDMKKALMQVMHHPDPIEVCWVLQVACVPRLPRAGPCFWSCRQAWTQLWLPVLMTGRTAILAGPTQPQQWPTRTFELGCMASRPQTGH